MGLIYGNKREWEIGRNHTPRLFGVAIVGLVKILKVILH
jgi:hypothetical protein